MIIFVTVVVKFSTEPSCNQITQSVLNNIGGAIVYDRNRGPTKKILDICARLEYNFGVKKINGEFVIYKNLGNGYDILVTGLDNYSKKFCADIKVRLLFPTVNIVETNQNIVSVEQLNLLLIVTVEKYLAMKDNTEYLYFLFGSEQDRSL